MVKAYPRLILIIVPLLSAALAWGAVSDLKPTSPDLARRYGPKKAMTQAEIDTLIKGIKWESNDTATGIGSPNAVKGGKIRWGEQSYPPTLRYFGENGNTLTTNQIHSLLCYETLLGLHPVSLEYVPTLANRWFIEPDRQTYWFKLDPRAKFSDGSPVTAYDVVATWDLLVDPGLKDPFNADFWGKFDRPEAITPGVVRVHAHELNWRLFMSFATNLMVFPQRILGTMTGAQYIKDWNNKMLPGSGPYALASAETNASITLKRRPDWWGKDLPMNRGIANFDEIQFVFVDNEDLLFEKVKKGELDTYVVNISRRWATECDFDKIKNGWILKRKVYNNKPQGIQGLAYNLRTWPFDDIRVREAMGYLYDRKKMIDKLFFNEYEFLDSMFPGGIYENPADPKVRFDPDKAVALLEQAGWLQKNRDSDGWLVKDGKRFEVNLNFTSPSEERYLTVFQENLKDVGIKLDLKQTTWAEDIKQVDERNFTISSRAFTGEIFPNPEQFASKFADLKANNNIWGLKDKRVDALAEKEKVTFDVNARAKIIREIDGIMCNLYLYTFDWSMPFERLLYWNKFGTPDSVLTRYDDYYPLLVYWWADPAKKTALDSAMKNNTSLPTGDVIVKYWEKFAKDHPGK